MGTLAPHARTAEKIDWIFCQPVPVNGWVLALVYEKAELLAPPRAPFGAPTLQNHAKGIFG